MGIRPRPALSPARLYFPCSASPETAPKLPPSRSSYQVVCVDGVRCRSLMPCSLTQPLICSGDPVASGCNIAAILLRVDIVSLPGRNSYRLTCLSLGFRLLEPIAAFISVAVSLPGSPRLRYAQNFGAPFLAPPSLDRARMMVSIDHL